VSAVIASNRRFSVVVALSATISIAFQCCGAQDTSNFTPDLNDVPAWCDIVQRDDWPCCSCLRRVCTLRRGIHDGELRLQAGNPPTEFVFRYVRPGSVHIGLTDPQQAALAREHGNLLLGHNARSVQIIQFTEGFFILDRELTCDQFKAVLHWGREHNSPSAAKIDSRGPLIAREERAGPTPINLITWREAYLFCEILQSELRLSARLPLEVEWEYAARGPDSNLYPGGSTPPPPIRLGTAATSTSAVVRESLFESPVTLMSNHERDYSWCGVHDLAGNLSEWCLDVYSSSLSDHTAEPFQSSQIHVSQFPPDAKEASRSFRGASFGDSALEAAAPLRRFFRETKGNERIGFRPIITLDLYVTRCDLRGQ